MSGGFDSSGSQSGAAVGSEPRTAETAKSEAGAVKESATHAASDVAHTAKDEAVAVAGAAKSQIKDLYAQSRTELGDQASQQKERLAKGLEAAGDELGSMARNSGGGGIATDLVQQLSTRVSGAAAWLNDHEPADVLDEVKRFARRRPLVFIGWAALAGIVAGRLVRALAADQHDKSSSTAGGSASESRTTGTGATTPVGVPSATVAEPVNDSPLFDSTANAADTRWEAEDERPDTV